MSIFMIHTKEAWELLLSLVPRLEAFALPYPMKQTTRAHAFINHSHMVYREHTY